MATPTIKEIQEAVDQLADLRGDELVLDLGSTGPAVRTTGGTAVVTAENKQRLLTAVKHEAGVGRKPRRASVQGEEAPDIDVDTLSTWEEKAEVLDSIIDILDAGGWSTNTLAMIGKEIVDAGFARVEVGRFVKVER